MTKSKFDEDYFERGRVKGISGYMNYTWMPELTIRMAYYMISKLPIFEDQKVLDFGCAKGFLVRAFRILDIECYGVDISDYAIKHTDTEVKNYCWKTEGCSDEIIFKKEYDWMIAKDVFEHIPEYELRKLLTGAKQSIKKIFAVIPLGIDDNSDKFIIPDYHNDVTHITIKDIKWWIKLFTSCGWIAEKAEKNFSGVKENWTDIWPEGNAFFVLSRK